MITINDAKTADTMTYYINTVGSFLPTHHGAVVKIVIDRLEYADEIDKKLNEVFFNKWAQ